MSSSQTALLGGAAAIALLIAGGSASAQAPAPLPVAPPAPPPVTDGLGEDGFYLEADLVIRDDKNDTITARGEVEARRNGRTLRAEEVVYNQGTKIVTAKGNIVLVNADGSTQFADELTLDEDMSAGFARGFAMRMQPNVKIAADAAIRRNENVNELSRAVYTPCPVCADGGDDNTPTWQIKAAKVVQDRNKQLVYYQNAVVEMWGVPVAYLPVFWHADPSAKRRSGFLPPKVEVTRRRGFSYEQPYLQVLSPSSEVVLSPQFNADVNPFLNMTYRKRFYSGYLEARAGYTYERDVDGNGERFGERTHRSYLLAKGKFEIDDKWDWGFAAERTSDDFLFDNYSVDDVYSQRGLFTPDDHRLMSQVYTTRQDARSYLSIAAVSVQGLRIGDQDRTFPTVAPLVEARWEPESAVAGGRLRIRASGVVLNRDQSQSIAPTPADPRPAGADSRRATGEASWRRDFTLSSGLRVTPFLQTRFDTYNVSDLAGVSGSDTVTRGLGVAGADISWPFFKRLSAGSIVLEPVAQIAISPDSDLDSRIPNEDSLAFEFDENNLFRANKSPGFDLYEGGRRLNAGGRARISMDDGREASLLIGRSFRAERDDLFPPRTGLQHKASDWVVSADAKPIKGVSVFTRSRLDNDTMSIRRLEAGADVSHARGYAVVRYLRDDLDINGFKQENFDVYSELFVTKNWGVSFVGSRDLRSDNWRRRDIGVVWKDDCLRVDVVFQREDQYVNTPTGVRIRPNDSIQLRLTLATLGDTGY
ncbi:LPS-assembly protein LptD [Caulobacter sp. NIBR2454]|uniref:LPS-assembly protein LptD n=1 Tax=Caulobacter sp. NIBR2454 TaxID=3015996 RepID=UPI0022B5E856|nr:LPS-assembly protein LptD [Caulobacter sp. NIBR2454]